LKNVYGVYTKKCFIGSGPVSRGDTIIDKHLTLLLLYFSTND